MMLTVSNGGELLTINGSGDALGGDLQDAIIELIDNYGGEIDSREESLLNFTAISWGTDFEKALSCLLDGYGFTLNRKGHEELTYLNRP